MWRLTEDIVFSSVDNPRLASVPGSGRDAVAVRSGAIFVSVRVGPQTYRSGAPVRALAPRADKNIVQY